MLSGLDLTRAPAVVEGLVDILEEAQQANRKFDFVIIDSQADDVVKAIVELLDSSPSLAGCHVIHYFTPTPETLSRDTGHVPLERLVRTHKPPRTLKLLQRLTSIKGYTSDRFAGADGNNEMITLAPSKRTLYGNVLIAEGAGNV
jgi:hypothetical protein